MRYVIAMVFAVIGAALMMKFVSSDVASMIVASRRFDNPDDVADMHTALFMGFNLAGLIAGWVIGWIFGSVLVPGEKAPE
jgi:phosphate/sulfate permease